MLTKQPFARRIAIAFTLMTLVVSGAFSLGIIEVVHFIEEHLVTQELNRELDLVLNDVLVEGAPPRLDAATRFFASDLPAYAIPPGFADGLAAGFTEVVAEDEAYYVYLREIDGRRYLLAVQQDEFEAREQMLFDVVLAGFLLSVAAAWLLGRSVANKVMAPLTRLAQQVSHRDQLHALAPPLALQYADDEVGHLAAAFDSTLGRLRQTLERERLFTSDVSHELRTPLMVILGACELLGQADLPERSRAQAQRIERAAQEMHELVQTFLLLARAEPEQAAFGGSASLASVVQEQSERWAPLFRHKGLSFEVIEEGQAGGEYNRTLLGSVMSNLLRNALHYTERGAVRLIVEANGFRVEDTGVGIPPEQQERMFQPFVRGAGARGEGLGLGLSLARRICTLQGWRIGVQPQAPQGSCFRVQFRSDAV